MKSESSGPLAGGIPTFCPGAFLRRGPSLGPPAAVWRRFPPRFSPPQAFCISLGVGIFFFSSCSAFPRRSRASRSLLTKFPFDRLFCFLHPTPHVISRTGSGSRDVGLRHPMGLVFELSHFFSRLCTHSLYEILQLRENDSQDLPLLSLLFLRTNFTFSGSPGGMFLSRRVLFLTSSVSNFIWPDRSKGLRLSLPDLSVHPYALGEPKRVYFEVSGPRGIFLPLL